MYGVIKMIFSKNIKKPAYIVLTARIIAAIECCVKSAVLWLWILNAVSLNMTPFAVSLPPP